MDWNLVIVLGIISHSLTVSEVVLPFAGGFYSSSILKCVFWCGVTIRTLLGIVLNTAIFLDWFQVWVWSLGWF